MKAGEHRQHRQITACTSGVSILNSLILRNQIEALNKHFISLHISNSTKFCLRNYFMYVNCHFQKAAIRSTSWRGGEGDPNAGGSAFADPSGAPPRLERSKSTQSSREHPPDSIANSGLRRFAGLNSNVSWDEDNLPEW